MQKDSRHLKVIRSVAFLLGTILLVPAAYFLGKSVLLLSFGASTQGYVAEVLPLGPSQSRGAPRMIVSFATPRGEIIRFQDNADYLHSHEVGQAVEVLYDRQRPFRGAA